MWRLEFPGSFPEQSEVEAVWANRMKFTEYEAKGIQPLVANSPLIGWMYHFLSVRQFSGIHIRSTPLDLIPR